jgi:hypothetical protein
MNVHHKESGLDNSMHNLATCCIACHAIQHIGRSLSLGVIEIWACVLPQVKIVQETRQCIALGGTLSEMKEALRLRPGPFQPNSMDYANVPIRDIGDKPYAQWEEPLCAIFVNLKRWQLDEVGN